MIGQEVTRPWRERRVLDESSGFEHVEQLDPATLQRLINESVVERADEGRTA